MNSPRCHGAKTGFTLIELLVVISIIAILAGLLLPALAKAKTKATAVHCMGNLKQLQYAWHMYALDNNDLICGNDWKSESTASNPMNWVSGWLDPRRNNYPDNTNELYLLDTRWASLGPYSKSARIYKCIASRVMVKNGGNTYQVVRTVSMNSWMGFISDPPNTTGFKNLRKLNDLSKITPSDAFAFIDERDDSIDDGSMAVDMVQNWIINFPASYHGGSGGVTFADGHAEIHHWRTPEFQPPQQMNVQQVKHEFLNVSSNNVDFVWLRRHATVRE